MSSSSTDRSTALGCVNKCSSLSDETSLSDMQSLLTEEEEEEGLDIFALEKALPKTSFSMARLAVPWQMGDGAAVLSQSLIGLRAAVSLALPARQCYQSSRD